MSRFGAGAPALPLSFCTFSARVQGILANYLHKGYFILTNTIQNVYFTFYNYKMSLMGPDRHNSLVSDAIFEMQLMSLRGTDCWLSRVEKMQNLLNIPNNRIFNKGNAKNITNCLKSRFDRLWLDSVNLTRTSQNDANDHNKLRTYRMFKGSFSKEPYIDLVRNRNQRSFLSRLRTGSHHLNIEMGRAGLDL